MGFAFHMMCPNTTRLYPPKPWRPLSNRNKLTSLRIILFAEALKISFVYLFEERNCKQFIHEISKFPSHVSNGAVRIKVTVFCQWGIRSRDDKRRGSEIKKYRQSLLKAFRKYWKFWHICGGMFTRYWSCIRYFENFFTHRPKHKIKSVM